MTVEQDKKKLSKVICEIMTKESIDSEYQFYSLLGMFFTLMQEDQNGLDKVFRANYPEYYLNN